MSVTAISREQTLGILAGPREVPADITNRVESMLTAGEPIVDVDRFSEFVAGLMVETPTDPVSAAYTSYESIITIGSCSVEMAWQQAGNIRIPRERRLHEHNQSVFNTYDRVFAAHMTDPRDRIIKPMLGLQDGGKTHAVAMTLLADPTHMRPNSSQAEHNIRMANSVLDPVPTDILSADEKTVIKLLVQQTSIGTALRRYHEKGKPFDEVIAEAELELNRLRAECPDDYKDRFDDYLVVTYLSDAGAHTQQARYVDVPTEEIYPDVTFEDRFNPTPEGSESRLTLDRLFSEAPEDTNRLRLYAPKHLAVMRHLFPGQANYYE